jgi:hypothetical protein
LNNVVEQDYRIIVLKGFRSNAGALSTISGYEAMDMIHKGQIRWLAKGDVIGQKQFLERTFGTGRLIALNPFVSAKPFVHPCLPHSNSEPKVLPLKLRQYRWTRCVSSSADKSWTSQY